MPYFESKTYINSGVAPLNEFHFEMLKKSFKGGAKRTLCPKKFGKKLARLGRASWAGLVLQRTSRGFDSPHDHLESCRNLVRLDNFGHRESCSLPNYSSGRSPDFFLTLCSLLPRRCLSANLWPQRAYGTCFFWAITTRYVTRISETTCYIYCSLPITNCYIKHSYFLSSWRTCSKHFVTRHFALGNWCILHSAPLPTSTIST